MSNSNYQIVNTLLQEGVANTLGKMAGSAYELGKTGLIYGGLFGLGYSILDRFSDLEGEDKKRLAQSVANHIKTYHLNINNPTDKATILNFVKSETSRIKNMRMVQQTGKGAAAGMAIGAGVGAMDRGLDAAMMKR